MFFSHSTTHSLFQLSVAALALVGLSIHACRDADAASGEKAMNEPKDIAGPITRQELEAKNFSWMKEGEATEKKRLSSADAEMKKKLAALGKKLGATDVEAYVASWCPDTHEQLPVFLSTLDASGAKPKSLKLFALDKRKTYPGYANERNIERIPTFVFLRDGKEVGRFVETPKKTVLDDLNEIIP
jgi:thiol-disulfide isomerase/thioredoxin